MPAQLLDGKSLAKNIRAKIKQNIQTSGVTPGLAIVLVGNDPASHLYVSLKEKTAKEVGMHFEKHLFFATEPEEKIIEKIGALNEQKDIHGIIVQLPLPESINEESIINAIDPKKDVDGFHPKNIALLLAGTPRRIPAVIRGILTLIEETGTILPQKKVFILSNSDIFASPLKKLLNDRQCAVRALHPKKKDPLPSLMNADLIISALGRPHAITKEMVKDGVIVIDVGTTREKEKTLGDVHPNVAEKTAWLTPVPGGVGPMTVAMLLQNVVEAV